MPSYQEFAAIARKRFQEKKKSESKEGNRKSSGPVSLTRHAEYKMKQYGLSMQKVRGVIRRPYRTETGVAAKTIAVMQPVNPKRISEIFHKSPAHNPVGNEAGKFPSAKETWKQEIWVMYQKKIKNKNAKLKMNELSLERDELKIISAWRYPGVSPERNPIPEDILQELVDQNILED